MAQYTKTYVLPSDARYTTNSQRTREIAKTNADLKGLIDAYNALDLVVSAELIDSGEIETAFETVKVPAHLDRFREMSLAGVLGGIAGAQPTGVIDTTTDLLTLTGVAYDSFLNGMTVRTEVVAAAANPGATILIAVTKAETGIDSGDIQIEVTLNDGTNNAATPVGLTTAQLALAITGGVSATYDSIECTITDAGGWLAHMTAASSGTTALAQGGEGDSDACLMNGGRNDSNGILGTYTTPAFSAISGGGGDEDGALIWTSSNSDTVGIKVPMPDSFSGLADVTVNIRAKSSGDTDTPTISVQTNWDEGDAPITDVSSAVNTDSAGWGIETATIALTDITAGADHCMLFLTPGAHTTDDVYVSEVYLTVDRVVTHA